MPFLAYRLSVHHAVSHMCVIICSRYGTYGIYSLFLFHHSNHRFLQDLRPILLGGLPIRTLVHRRLPIGCDIGGAMNGAGSFC